MHKITRLDSYRDSTHSDGSKIFFTFPGKDLNVPIPGSQLGKVEQRKNTDLIIKNGKA